MSDKQTKVKQFVNVVRDGAGIHGQPSLLASRMLSFHCTLVPTILHTSQWSQASLKCSWTQMRQWLSLPREGFREKML